MGRRTKVKAAMRFMTPMVLDSPPKSNRPGTGNTGVKSNFEQLDLTCETATRQPGREIHTATAVAILNATKACARRQHLDHRETSDAYRGVVLLFDRFRIAECRDGSQWLFQRKRPGFPGGGAAWDTLGYLHDPRRSDAAPPGAHRR